MANVDCSDHKVTPKPFTSDCFATKNKKKENKMLKYAELSSRLKAPSLHNLTFINTFTLSLLNGISNRYFLNQIYKV